eukprot:Lithocolla_globosa_v1_NODE_7752_length_904_cov_11.598351.p1 type:complete len:150 gc:universal NODE_7752_length_904_cov_11.598351:624-175(-)
MVMDMYGPESARHNDLYLLRESKINRRLAQLQAGRPKQYVIYGDAIFLLLSHIRRRHVSLVGPLPQRLADENDFMAKVRIAIEWDYGTTANLYPFLHYKRNLHLLRHPNISKLYFVGTLLKNCHVCLYGSQTASYFGCRPPTLEEYMQM